MKPSRLAALALAVSLAGCNFIPRYERPAAPVAPAYPGADAAAPGTRAADVAWQDFFPDERLRRLIALALDSNRDLRIAITAIEQARAVYGVRDADRFPTLNAGAGGSRTPLPGGLNTTSYNAGLIVSAWEIDFFGRIASLSEAAQRQYLASEEGRKATQITLIASIANTWLAVLADDELLEITRQTLASREESLRLSKLRFDAGATSELDYRQAESLLEAARVVLAQTQRQRALDENALTLLVGQPLPPGYRGTATTATIALADVPAGLPSELLERRPDILQAEQNLISYNANIGAARAAFFPRISLTAGLGFVSTELSGLVSDGNKLGVTLAPQVLLPLFDWGRNRSNLALANAQRDTAVAQYERSIQVAFREVADALAGRATLGEQLRAQRAQADAEAVRLRLSDLRYTNGVASYLDLLDAQRSLFAARQAVVNTRLAQLQNQVTLYRVLGGGWTETSEANRPAQRATP